MDDANDQPLTPTERLQAEKQSARLINNILEPQLQELQSELQRLDVETCGFRDLQKTIAAISDPSNVESMVDVGGGCFVQAVIPDASKLLVKLGVQDILVEMSLSETLAYAGEREKILRRFIAATQLKIDRVSADLQQARVWQSQLRLT